MSMRLAIFLLALCIALLVLDLIRYACTASKELAELRDLRRRLEREITEARRLVAARCTHDPEATRFLIEASMHLRWPESGSFADRKAWFEAGFSKVNYARQRAGQ